MPHKQHKIELPRKIRTEIQQASSVGPMGSKSLVITVDVWPKLGASYFVYEDRKLVVETESAEVAFSAYNEIAL